MAYMPVCFGISFTNTMMNQARALVHVYADGSVSVATGAIEMGQGVNTKMLQVAAEVFSIDASKIKIQTTSTHKIANTSPSAASATADLNGKAVLMACNAIADRLKSMLAHHTCLQSPWLSRGQDHRWQPDSQIPPVPLRDSSPIHQHLLQRSCCYCLSLPYRGQPV